MGEQYKKRDVAKLDAAGDFYVTHVEAMTAEGLHTRSDIAAELAWRDYQIARLTGIIRLWESGIMELAAAADEKRRGRER